jgi:6-pyruvoyltetrahydropterin/6-carboxytetrahydropterin synthase
VIKAKELSMYTVRVRDRMMIAHSFKGEIFGPAQKLHGATFVVDVTLSRAELGPEGIVVDIGRACTVLGEVLGEVNYRNLDEVEEFAGQNTTTEFMARWIYDRMREALGTGGLGAGAKAVSAIKVEIAESDIAWAGFEGPAV